MKHFSFIAVSLLASACSMPQDAVTADENTSKNTPFAHTVSDIEPDPSITYGVLENGLRYAVMENDTPSGVGALHMRLDTGSINETDAQRGLAHFLEHMAFNGTKNVPEGEMVRRLERFGLSFGADTNAHTSFDETVYKLNLPTLEDDVLDEAFFLMNETVRHMNLDPGAIERERGIIFSEKRTRDSAAFQQLVHQIDFFTAGSGLGDRLPIGIDETIETMPASEFEAYYRDYYHPENTFVVFVGDISEAGIISRIEATFGDWQPEKPPAAHRELAPIQVAPGTTGYYYDPEITTNIQLAVVRPFEEHPDTSEKRRRDVTQSIGNRILSRRMRTLADEPEATFLSATTRSLNFQNTVDSVSLDIRTTPENWQNALMTGEQEIRRAIEFGFSQAEVDEQLARLRVSYQYMADGADTRSTTARSGGLVSGIVSAFGSDRVFSHPSDQLSRFESLEDEMTAESVSAAFKANWAGFDAPVVYLATSLNLDDADSQIKAVVSDSQSVAVAAPEEMGALEFVYTNFGDVGSVVSETYLESVDSYLIQFDNNVLLNFKRTDFKEDIILMRATIGDGPLAMPRKDESLRRLGYNLLSKGGLEAHNRDQIETLTAGKAINATLGVWPSEGYFRLTGFSTPADLSDAMNLLVASVVAPGYDERARERYLESLTDWFPTHDSMPQGVIARYAPRLIRSGDERFGYSELSSFLTPTIEEAKAWIEPELDHGLIELTIVGDVDKDTLVAEVARTFGALPDRKSTRGVYPEMTSLTFPEGQAEPVQLVHNGEPNQALLRIYWPTPDASDVKVTRQMRVLQSVFRNRLVEQIREGEAAAYSPGVGRESDRTFPGYGYIFVSLDLTPETVENIRMKTLSVAADLANQTITQDEYIRAITPILEDLDANLENNNYWMTVLGDAQTGGFGLEDHASRETDYAQIERQDIQELASQVFNNENAFSIVVKPETLSLR